MTLLSVPIIDISAAFRGDEHELRTVARAINQACEDVGFFVITGHGVDPAISSRFFDAGRRFFASSLDRRVAVKKGEPADPTGYFPKANTELTTKNGASPPNIRESFGIIREDSPSGRTNRWPADDPDLKAAGTAY
jgi:isopenicillin N synthase-like dioxygenase